MYFYVTLCTKYDDIESDRINNRFNYYTRMLVLINITFIFDFDICIKRNENHLKRTRQLNT